MKTGNFKGAIGKKVLVVFLVLFALFCVVAVGGGIARVVTGDESLTLASLLKRVINQQPIIRTSGTKTGTLIKASNEKSAVELESSEEGMKLTLATIEKSRWPQDASGGIYELLPSGEFEKGVTFKMTLKETPPADFALGYWHPDTKKWEWLPTARTSDKTFETSLPHATEIGGASGGACSTPPKDPENQAMTNEVAAQMRQVGTEQQTGQVSPDDEKQWKKAWDAAKELTDKAINDYCKNRNLTTQHDFYAAWEVAQCLGFHSLNERFVNAWENNCQDKEKTDVYEIDQKDDYSATFNLSLKTFYNINSQHKGTVHYSASRSGKSLPGKPAWRTDWKVFQYVTDASTTNQTAHLEGDADEHHTDWDMRALGTAGTTTDLMVSMFSLENVKEGESFPITIARAGEYYSRMSGPNATFRLHTYHIPTGMTVQDQRSTASMNSEMTLTTSPTFQLSATLTKDLGEAGAIVTVSSDIKFTPEQEKAFQEVIRLQRASGLPGIADMWTAPGKLNSNIFQSEGGTKPWRIYKVGDVKESEPEENDWQGSQKDLDDARRKARQDNPEVNPNDKDGDGLPDLVPLTNENDRNADGIPDLAPIPGN